MATIYNQGFPDDPYAAERLLDAYESVEKLESGVMEAERKFYSIKPDTEYDICSLMGTVKQWTELIGEIREMISSASGIEFSEELANTLAGQITLKYLEMILLYAKRLTVKIKKKVAEFSKDVILGTINSKGSAIPDAITSAINAAFAALGLAVNAVLAVIDTFMGIVSSMPLTSLAAQGMCLFATPKSFKKTDIRILNTNQMSADRLPDAMKMAIFEIEKTVVKINDAIKIAAVAAGATAGAVSVLTKRAEEIGLCENMDKLRPGKLNKAIDSFLDLIPIPLGLPRYEKLKITNLGFMAFLITGFEPCAHKSFGIPGFF